MKTTSTRRPQAERRRDAHRKLTNAVIACLDQYGYAQTSISTVQEAAGVSRGALLHHFPSKLALMAGTARALLDRALALAERVQPEANTSYEELLVDYWRTVVDTPAGRAFLEILTASRTDEELRAAISQVVVEWESELTAARFERFLGRSLPRSVDIDALWGVSRAFLRGLVLEMPRDADRAERRVRLFARMFIDHLSRNPEIEEPP